MDPRTRNSVAQRAFVATIVVVAVVAGALALWKLRLLLSLLFLALIISAAMRPGVEALARRRIPRSVRVGQTWNLVDLKLGAYVRGSLLLIVFVSAVLSGSFWAIGLPYWLLLGIFAGLVEVVPVIGPLTAGLLAVGVGLTVSVQAAALAAVAVYGLRVFQDYVINPRVLGHAVGLTPLVVLVGVAAVGLLFGGAYVPLATPLVAVVATIVDVAVRGKDPAKEPVPAVIFPAQETEAAGAGKRR